VGSIADSAPARLPGSWQETACTATTPPPLPAKRASCFSFWLVACLFLFCGPKPFAPTRSRPSRGAQQELRSRATAKTRVHSAEETIVFQCEAVRCAPERPDTPVARPVPVGLRIPTRHPRPSPRGHSVRNVPVRAWRVVATRSGTKTLPRARPRAPTHPRGAKQAHAHPCTADPTREDQPSFFFPCCAERARPISLPPVGLATARQKPAGPLWGTHTPRTAVGCVAGPPPAGRPDVDALRPDRGARTRAAANPVCCGGG